MMIVCADRATSVSAPPNRPTLASSSAASISSKI
jgi:hypothetical protein